MRKFIAYIVFFFLCALTFAQVPGTWNEYFSFRNVQQLESVDDNVFALSENGIFIYNTSSQEIQKITKLNGLSTVGLTCMAFCDSTSSFLIGYNDGTLDILDYPSLKVKPIPTIANKSIYGSKKINAITMHNDTAIIATEFGVLSFSMKSRKFISTTILSNDGSYVPAKSVTVDDKTVYVATTKGVFSAAVQNANLSDYSSWAKLTDIPYENDTISYIATLNDIVYYVHKDKGDATKDSIFTIKNGTADAFKVQMKDITSLRARNNSLSITAQYVAKIYDSTEKLIYQFDSLTVNNQFSDIIQLDNGETYIGDKLQGLYKSSASQPIFPNGPNSNHITDMHFQDNALHMVCGNISNWEMLKYNVKTYSGYWYGHSNWKLGNSICIYAMPNTKYYYIGTYGYGFSENEVSWTTGTVYDASNSILHTYYSSDKNTSIYDITSDTYGNLWLLNPGNDYPLAVRDANNNWYSYYIEKTSGNLANQKNLFKHFLIDRRGYKWLVGTGSVGVFYDNKTLDDTSDDSFVRIALNDNEGSIAEYTTCIAEDNDGDIWIGTSQGIAVHSSPSRVFKDRQTISRIKIEIDGEVGYLLSSESITCIAVDGANRKWVGTENSGVFLISENGTEQLLNFTKNNSPLPSNSVTCISIDHATGEVYIGTELGLVSYIGDATAGDQTMNKVKIYPNPVRESYDGDIYIQGLVSDAIVKITDVSGNLVRTVVANGGTAIWDGRNIYGDRVKTGVYLIYISDDTGQFTKVTKILFIN